MPKVNITWHASSDEDVINFLETSEMGLSSEQAAERLSQYGSNKLDEGKKKTFFEMLLSQFKDFMIWVLIAAALISGLLGEWVDAAIIMVVVILNAVMGAIQESRAESALEALAQMAAPFAKVMRDGAVKKIPAEDLVIGDLVLLEAGDSVPADMRLISCNSLKVEESALTGESLPVEKDTAVIDNPSVALGDRLNMAHMGTSVTYGRASGLVTATGMDTQMGKIAHQLANTQSDTTPLQKKLNQISQVISMAVITIAALIFVVGLISGREALDMFMTAVSLAVAAIPEGMVAVVTIVLALGTQRMAGRGAIIRKLPAVETLGSTQVICSDKTGTLTENRMTVQKVWTGSDNQTSLFGAMFLCNDSLADEAGVMIGDPTETALLDYLLKQGICTVESIRSRQRAGEIPFDSDRKLSTVVMDLPNGQKRVYVKGAPDVLLARCTHRTLDGKRFEMRMEDLLQIEQENENMAGQALRVLAFAYKDVDSIDTDNAEQTENNLAFCGLAGMIDPARPEAKAAIAICRKAGIIPVMITGDHKITAAAIAGELGILEDGREVMTGPELDEIDDEALARQVEGIGVYARVAPEHKTRIISAWQSKGKVVAMTGDGVNDAPALKAADIGVGMGITGTDVSKGASDMVLTDDNFSTIVSAVSEGRSIFDNIHKTVRFLLSSNCGEVITMLVATFLSWKILAPVHILWVNLVTDSLPALALGVEPPEDGIMDRKPRDQKTPFLTGGEWARVAITGAVEALLTIIAFIIGRTVSSEMGVTMAFATLSISQLFAALGFQSEHSSLFKIRAKEHPMLWLGLGASLLLQLVVMLIPGLRIAFGLALPGAIQWLQIIGLCLVMLAFTELLKLMAHIRQK